MSKNVICLMTLNKNATLSLLKCGIYLNDTLKGN